MDIGSWNEKIWEWQGCDKLQAGQVFCISSGWPPMPASDPNAICGPQVNGTKRSKASSDLSLLNPCPLNVCCNIWGQCGITEEFCTASESDSGAPGTAASGQNGCISNCGIDVVDFGRPVREPYKIGYFEGYNSDRDCLVMDPSQVDADKYTHLHFAFANISSETFEIGLHGTEGGVWNEFKIIKGPKIICSFGGWSFSTSDDSYNIFGQAVSFEHRGAFIENILNFVENEDIDGVDFDWEYPGAEPYPGIHAGNLLDGALYFGFLRDLRAALPDDKSISIAAPAAYWSLKAFPIKEMAEVVDYIVYMTYDMHGQWDYGNKYSAPGCEKGNCLRSHVNLTETNIAVAMILKAGVPQKKLVVGIASYGRSFEMDDADCTGPECTYTGPDSGALPGQCTVTPGILANAEIMEILELDSSAKTWYNAPSGSDIMVYNDTQWVAYMSDDTKQWRHDYFLNNGFLGTADWAIDLGARWSEYCL